MIRNRLREYVCCVFRAIVILSFIRYKIKEIALKMAFVERYGMQFIDLLERSFNLTYTIRRR